MSNESPLNVREDAPDSPTEAQEYDPISPKHTQPQAVSDGLANKVSGSPSDGFPPLPPGEAGILDQTTQVLKKGKVGLGGPKARKRKGKKGKARRKVGLSFAKDGRSGKAVAAKPQAVLPIPDQAIEAQPLTASDPSRQPPTGEEGACSTGRDRIGLHPEADKNSGEKEPCLEAPAQEQQPVEGVEDVLKDGIEEVQTRAELYREQRGVWEAQGDISVRVYARPLNPRLILVEWEGEDGVEKHGSLVVNSRQRGMFGPGKVVWVRGPLVGSRWLLAGKYNFLGNRVA